jgi:hypothetical protein
VSVRRADGGAEPGTHQSAGAGSNLLAHREPRTDCHNGCALESGARADTAAERRVLANNRAGYRRAHVNACAGANGFTRPGADLSANSIANSAAIAIASAADRGAGASVADRHCCHGSWPAHHAGWAH